MNADQFQFVIDNTKVIIPPQALLNMNGAITYNFFLLSEDMDSMKVMVREGQVTLKKPEKMSVEENKELLIQGFGEDAWRYMEHIDQLSKDRKCLKLGWHISKDKMLKSELKAHMQEMLDKLSKHLGDRGNPCDVLIKSIEDGWEVSLVNFIMLSIANAGMQGNLIS